ncbi:hypothetical protein TVAG_120160 [Trichomonas vaginalis G3]|uniref:Uncharacterized protein n=1 Tax=Trichomonas vaginalis (strain ATCC PRA-98 / G3) TaxID=412133 RepID=A2D7G2_TRIV3|nr:hypothetical protein TVAGG3_0993070 [Trichomonas vaginalis G3]EAY23679.1 hypothetical protein TVAG_120160 [Trichomonas vaginalis G3]KAI5490171.1 hypothetical protein TVAGG3_0993070 [Trichomonas vaginalis G3]|eukprot:XP_001276927.1 hypothetical protein [Trichomonas vaginalis G3]
MASNPKTRIAVKQYLLKLQEQSCRFERVFRVQLLQELSAYEKKNGSKIRVEELKKMFPSDCLEHPILKKFDIGPREQMNIDQLHFMLEEKEMMSERKRDEMNRVFHDISSGFHIFSDYVEQNNLNFSDFCENAEDIIRRNTNLHKRLQDIILKDPPEFNSPKMWPVTDPEVLKTHDIIKEKMLHDDITQDTIRRNTLSSLGTSFDDNQEERHSKIESFVRTQTPSVTTRCISSRDIAIERDNLYSRLADLSTQKFVDVETLKSELVELENKKRTLLDRRNKVQTQLNTIKRKTHRSSTASLSKIDPIETQSSQIELFNDIKAKNKSRLAEIQAENAQLHDKIRGIEIDRDAKQFFES